ncbi:MAG: SURF1 family protein [Phenylobacterium sp.]|jgi:surfeit locus 1 family protein|uniref:SURF1 family protein n=1 Tax=Phenylobacterium sp. TaxID=1871053 RepID=UPI003016DAA2
MTTEPAPPTRFPVGLTIATLIGLAILIALGNWQLQRRVWKEALLARIARLESAAPVDAAQALSKARTPADLDMVRVRLACPGISGAAFVELYGLLDGHSGRRLVSACPLGTGGSATLLVDRGFIDDAETARPVVRTVTPGGASEMVTGILRVPDPPGSFTPKADLAKRLWFSRDVVAMAATLGGSRPAPVMLMAESRTNPDLPALTPSPLPAVISNRHMEYALTWFGLAGALAGVYAARLWKHFRS